MSAKRRLKAKADPAREDLRALVGRRRVDRKVREFTPGATIPAAAVGLAVVHLGDAKWGVNVARLHDIEDALARGAPIDAGLREELQALLAVVGYDFAARAATRPGPKAKPERRRRAAIVLALHDSHGIKLELALNAVCLETGTEDERRKDRQNVERAYHELAAEGGRVRVLESDVRAALERIGEPYNPK